MEKEEQILYYLLQKFSTDETLKERLNSFFIEEEKEIEESVSEEVSEMISETNEAGESIEKEVKKNITKKIKKKIPIKRSLFAKIWSLMRIKWKTCCLKSRILL